MRGPNSDDIFLDSGYMRIYVRLDKSANISEQLKAYARYLAKNVELSKATTYEDSYISFDEQEWLNILDAIVQKILSKNYYTFRMYYATTRKYDYNAYGITSSDELLEFVIELIHNNTQELVFKLTCEM